MLEYRGSREAVEFINRKLEEQGNKKKAGSLYLDCLGRKHEGR
jgi:hypothetical protein